MPWQALTSLYARLPHRAEPRAQGQLPSRAILQNPHTTDVEFCQSFADDLSARPPILIDFPNMKLVYLTLSLLWLAQLPAHAEIRALKVAVERGADGATKVSIKSDVASENRTKTTTADAAEVLKNAAGWGSTVDVTIETNGEPLSDYLPLLSAIASNTWLSLSYVGQLPKPPQDPPEAQPYKERVRDRAANDPLSEENLLEAAKTDDRARHLLADLWARNILSAKTRERILEQHVKFTLEEQFPYDPKAFPTARELKIIATTDFPFPESAWVEYSGTIALGDQQLQLPVDAFDNSRSLHRCNTRYFASLGTSSAGEPTARGVIQMREVRRDGVHTETVWSIKRFTNEIKLQKR